MDGTLGRVQPSRDVPATIADPRSRPVATVSIDVDPIDVHLAGYGITDAGSDPLVYREAVPRLLDLLAEADLRATFFIIGRDVEPEAAVIRRIADAGHEVAAHSATHPTGLTLLDDDGLRGELAEPRVRLEDVIGRPVLGFRAPNWDVDRRVWTALAASGYRYDASGYPSLLHIPARILQAVRSQDRGRVLRMRPLPPTMRRRPFRLQTDAGPLVEFPVSVAPWSTVPLYHTVRYFAIGRGFERHLAGQLRRRAALSYALHAVDVLGLEEDEVDPRLARHPGLDRPLDAKLELVRTTLAAIAAGFAGRTFAERLGRLEHPGSDPEPEQAGDGEGLT